METLYRVKLRQCRPVEVWASSKDEAFEYAINESEWDDNYEELESEEDEE